MPTKTLIRSDKKHAVNMPKGSNVAERKTTQKYSDPDSTVESPTPSKKTSPAKVSPAKRKAAPAAPAKTIRDKATLTRNATTKASPVPTNAPQDSAPASKTKTTKPALPIWGQDSQVKLRIEQLKIRNAQLAEQLQRLTASPTARGNRP